MKIEFKYEFISLTGNKEAEVSHVIQEDNLGEVVQAFRHFLLGIGFSPESVDNYIEAN